MLYDTVTKLKWAVDVRTHSAREIVERLLAEDLEWADEPSPDDDDKIISQVTWPWWGSGEKDKDKDEDKDTKKVKLPVPVAKEEADCVVRPTSFDGVDTNCTHNSGRIALTGNMVNGKNKGFVTIEYPRDIICRLISRRGD